jgi:hypothetical protein
MMKNNVYKRSCNYKKTSNTLDFCHKHNIESFDLDRENLNEKYKNLDILKKDIESIQSKPNNDKSDEDFINIVSLNDAIKEIEKCIQNIVSNKAELDYYSNTIDILYNYYDLVENNSDNNMNITNHLTNSNNSKKKSILEYFHEHVDVIVANNEKDDIIPNDNNRASLLDEYLSITDKNYINDNIDNNIALQCDHCGSIDKTVINNDSISICNKCNSVQHLLTDNEKPSYKDPPKEISYFSYKRINHYQEWLNQIQGKETTDIPEEIFDKIMLELKKQRITNIKEVNRQKVKEILKKLKINKYYEHIPYILNRITGIPNPNLTQELEEKLRNMFKEIQVPFLKHSPLVRKNFLSYSYVIHKFIQILKRDEYLKYFPLLKSREKLHQQEEIWKKICIDLGWKFYRSI